MKEFISHIDYLVQKHDCVIIPGFGGFVISHEGASIVSDGAITPPKVSVGFNPDLKSNDGLLAESYMTMYSISYDEACQKIEEAVNRLNIILGMNHPVQIGRLGKLSLDKSKRLIFSPNANLSIFHPDTFGLSAVNMKRLVDIEKDKAKIKRLSMVKRVFAGAGAAAAAVLIFFIASTPISVTEDAQKSSFLSDLTSSLQTSETSVTKTVEPVEAPVQNIDVVTNVLEQQNLSESAEVVASEPVIESPVDNQIIESENSVNDYYIIIAGATSESEAKRLIERFQSQGLNNLGSVSSRNRIRIYAASFDSREKAEEYLIEFKKENPELNDAWVYHKD